MYYNMVVYEVIGMKLLVEVNKKQDLCLDKVDGVILALKDYSVESTCFYTLDEIEEITKKNSCEVL